MHNGFARFFSALALALPWAASASAPDLFNNQWAIKAVHWRDVNSIMPEGQPPVVVAVIGSGVDPGHPMLEDRIHPGGRGFLSNGDTVLDDVGHETHVSATIAGLTPQTVEILPLRVLGKGFRNFSHDGRLLSEIVADAIGYAVKKGADIINLSLGWPQIADSPVARDAVRSALDHGVLVVAAAGNDRREMSSFPCAYPGVLCVGAAGENGEATSFTNFGGEVDVLAPGKGIVSAYPLDLESRVLRVNGYERMDGSSQAAAFVSAELAILKVLHPAWSADQILAHALGSASPVRKAGQSLYGMISFEAALVDENQARYLPSFKSTGTIALDRADDAFSGEMAVRCLVDCPARPDFALQSLDSKIAVTRSEIVSGASRDFRIRFSGKALADAPDRLPLSIRIGSQEFRGSVQLARQAEGFLNQAVHQFPKDLPLMTSRRGLELPLIRRVDDLFETEGPPEYFLVSEPGQNGTVKIQWIRPSHHPETGASVIPSSESVAEIVRLDADLDGKPDYAILTIDRRSSRLHYRFINDQLEPLYGDASDWELDLTNPLGRLAIRSFGGPASWIKMTRVSGQPFGLVPGFFAVGPWPVADGPGQFRLASREVRRHYYYLDPVRNGSQVTLTPRVLDSARFYEESSPYLPPDANLSLVSSLSNAREAGAFQLLFSAGSGFGLSYFTADPRALNLHSLPQVSVHFTANSMPVLRDPGSQASGETAYSEFFSNTAARLVWLSGSTGKAEFLDVEAGSADDPLSGTIALAETEQSRFALLDTRYEIIAIKNGRSGERIQQETPLVRDSSFGADELREMILPKLITHAHGQPRSLAAYFDSILIRGDTIGCAFWNKQGEFRRLARYSMQVPRNCAEMDPFISPDTGMLEYVLLCDSGNHWELRFLEP